VGEYYDAPNQEVVRAGPEVDPDPPPEINNELPEPEADAED
jgi:hypothetical protein